MWSSPVPPYLYARFSPTWGGMTAIQKIKTSETRQSVRFSWQQPPYTRNWSFPTALLLIVAPPPDHRGWIVTIPAHYFPPYMSVTCIVCFLGRQRPRAQLEVAAGFGVAVHERGRAVRRRRDHRDAGERVRDTRFTFCVLSFKFNECIRRIRNISLRKQVIVVMRHARPPRLAQSPNPTIQRHFILFYSYLVLIQVN